MADGAVAQIEMIKGGEAFGAESVLTKMAGAVTALDWGHFGDDGGALLAVADDNGVVKILEFMLG